MHTLEERPELKNACHLKLPWLESGERNLIIPKFSFTVHLEIHQLVQY